MKMTKILFITGISIREWTPSMLGSLLSACAKQHYLNIGRTIHANMLKRDWWWGRDLYVQNHLVNFYAKCEKMEWAQYLFDEMPMRNIVTWTTLVSGYNQCGRSDRALQMFSLMVSEDLVSSPNEFTYASAITACTKQQQLRQGMQLHSHALQRGFLSHVLVSNVLISFYMACGWAVEGEMVFQEILEPDQVSWNSLVSGLSQNGFLQVAIDRFHRMRESEEKVTSFALSTAITACLEDEAGGKKLHGLAAKLGLDSESFTGCSMIRMYSVFKNMESANKVFEELGFKDVASWNSLIEGYGGSDQGEMGLQIFGDFLRSGLRPDEITITAILGICTNLVMLEYGKQIHSLNLKIGLGRSIRIVNSMIDMYSKGGSLEDGIKAFRFMEERSLVSWTAMMGGLANHGRGKEVIQLFEEMKREGLKPNKVTYTCVLSACSHGGLLDFGRNLFNSMEIAPETDHLVCMVHMLAGGGRFEEAKEFIQRSPVEHTQLLWNSFLIACKKLGEWDIAVEVAEKIIKAGLPDKSPMLVLLSNVFAATGRWEEAREIREKMKERKMKKEPGCSWIEVDNEFQVFGMNKQFGAVFIHRRNNFLCKNQTHKLLQTSVM